MGKRRTVLRNQMNNADVVMTIKADILAGLNKKEISKKHRLDLGRVVKAINSLRNDPDVIKYREELDKANKAAQEETVTVAPVVEEQVQPQNEVVVQEEVKEDKSVEHSNKLALTDEVKIAIAEDYNTGNYTQIELVAKYKISRTTIQNVIKELIPKERRKEISAKNKKKKELIPKEVLELVSDTTNIIHEEVKEEPMLATEEVIVQEEIKEVPPVQMIENNGFTINTDIIDMKSEYSLPTDFIEDLVEVSREQTYITVGLIDGRHDINVDKFIYDRVNNSDIFNFTYLEDIAKNFIKDNIQFNEEGVAKQGLIVKCTGLQSALMAVVKMCYNMKVNLIAAHYQINDYVPDKYRQQPIFTDFPIVNDYPYQFNDLTISGNRLFLYNSKCSDYNNIKEFYELKVFNRDSKYRQIQLRDKYINSYSLLMTNLEDAMKMNILLSSTFIMNRSFYRTIELKKFTADGNISSGYSRQIIQSSHF